MMGTYRKRGRAVRYEGGYLLRVEESGEATEDAGVFKCAPLNERTAIPEIDSTEVERVVSEIRSAVSHPLSIERLIVSEGIAEHELGAARWSERIRRVHVAVAFRSLRALVDLAAFDLEELWQVVRTLSRCDSERPAPQRIRLAPRVTAALLPSLIGVAPPNVTLWQAAGGRDGTGQPIAETRVVSPPWPNWFRPTYRVRPIRAPHNLRLDCDVTEIDRNVPEAVALLAPVEGLTLPVLCVDGAAVYPTTVRVVRIDAVGPPTAWYPYAAGSFGAVCEVIPSAAEREEPGWGKS